MAQTQPFTRLNDPAASPQTRQIHGDIYDKLNRLEASLTAAVANVPTVSTPTMATVTRVITATSISGATGTAATPQYTFIPSLTAVPDANPTTGAPYAQDGIVIEFAPASGDVGVLFRYNATTIAWSYAAGNLSRTQSGLAGLASILTTVHAGLLVYVTDYAHMLQWTGSAWTRGPGDSEHSDTFHPAGAAITDTGWHACDGTTVSFLKYDGTLGSRILPNTVTTPSYAKPSAVYSATITAATLPTISGSTGATAVTLAGATAVESTDTTILFTAGVASVTVAGQGHTHAPGTLNSPTHTHTVTSANSPIALPGDPVASFPVILCYRQ